MIEERMLLLLRQGKISKWFSGIGQEAISVGCTLALDDDEYILPLHRNLGVFTTRNVPLTRLFCQLQGKYDGFSKGRERSFHFGTNEHHIVGMISHLGPQMAVAGGIALSHVLRKEKKLSLVFSGEGGTSEGDFHEAINVAAVWELPVIFVIENNGYGLSTPSKDQFRCEKISDKAKGYGIEGITIDGNNLLEVYETISNLAQSIRKNPRPVLVECLTFRMRGHEEASGTKYVPKDLIDTWAKKDPILHFENLVNESKILSLKERELIKSSIQKEIEKAEGEAFSASDPIPESAGELSDVYKHYVPRMYSPNNEKKTKKRFIDAISDGLRSGLQNYPNLVLMGQDIAEYGGVFKITEGFLQEFGKERVRNTPLCESAILGAALGLSIGGFKSVVEMQFSDFVSSGFNQIVNNLAKIHWRWGQNADVVVRMPAGAGVGAGPFHSQSNEAWFTKTPGLKVVFPSNPHDAKGLLLASIEDPNPVMFFEHKLLYRSIQDEIPDDHYTIPLGKAHLVQDGSDVCIITYGIGVLWAKELAQKYPHYSIAILDLRTLVPLDVDALEDIVKKTGRVFIVHEDTLFGGFGGEISSIIGERLFQWLDAPVVRCGSLDTPIPFAGSLERNFLAKSRMENDFEKLMTY